MMTQSHRQLTDKQFESQFADCIFDPELFNHEAHLRLAYIHIQNYGLPQAIINICEQLAMFDKIHGDGSKFNKTVTIAAVYLVEHFMRNKKTHNFYDFLQKNTQLVSSFRSLVDKYYSFDIFRSQAARKSYLEPDLQEF